MEHEEPLSLKQIVAATKYPLDAFHFVRRGLDYTVHQVHVNPDAMGEAERHVDGRQLCEGLRDYAVAQYGQLACTVLRRWRITRTEDFGQIVFAMVNGGLMQAQDDDDVSDFDDLFEFGPAFSVTIPVDHVPTDASEVGAAEQD